MPSSRTLPLRSLHHAATKSVLKISPVPITTGEFYEHFLKCIPPTGWGDRIVVANSGGPDSVCLLHLLSSVVKQCSGRSPGSEQSGFPSRVYSVHVNHNLQAANAAMQDAAQSAASRVGVDHRTETIPWGTGLFPPRPQSHQPVEDLARQARSARLFVAMQAFNAKCIAYAHHADDQVETSIMRLTKGSQIWGASGMKPVRRWGMNSNLNILPVGAAGMLHWIIRPLLDVPKDRILATCEANGLEYVVDPTNFQSEITLRNSVRQYLREREEHLSAETDTAFKPHHLTTNEVEVYERAIERLSPGTPYLPDLREAVGQLSKNVERLEVQANNALSHCVVPSPPSAVILSQERLRDIIDPNLRIAMVRRILRYVSPKPWGSLAAIGHAHSANLQEIATRLWDDSAPAKSRFTVGGEVLWVPAVLNHRGELRLRTPINNEEPVLWVAQRAPPEHAKKAALTVDLTNQLRSFTGPRMLYLYDNRFWFRFDKEWIGEGLSVYEVLERGCVEIRPESQQFLPQVVWVREGKKDTILGQYAPMWRGVPWIQTVCMRTLTAL